MRAVFISKYYDSTLLKTKYDSTVRFYLTFSMISTLAQLSGPCYSEMLLKLTVDKIYLISHPIIQLITDTHEETGQGVRVLPGQ